MKIFDSHCHIETGLEKYNISVSGKNIIFNSIDSYNKFHFELKPEDSLTLIFDFRENMDLVRRLVDEKKIDALKIHSRIQKIRKEDYPELLETLNSLKPDIPFVVDAFYHGTDPEIQPSLEFIIELAKKYSSLPVVVAHSGGIHVSEYFRRLKSIRNIYFDLSFSLSYLRQSPVYADFKKLVSEGDENKIIFGTDYPFIDPVQQLNLLVEIFDESGINKSAREKILYSNARNIFK